MKDHGHPSSELDDVHFRRVDVGTIQFDLPLETSSGNEVVHTVERSQERRFAATGRADQGRNESISDLNRNSMKSFGRAIVKIRFRNIYFDRPVHSTSNRGYRIRMLRLCELRVNSSRRDVADFSHSCDLRVGNFVAFMKLPC